MAYNKYYSFTTPDTASVRVPVGVNEDGDIATGDEVVVETKTLQFSYTATTATAEEIIYGENALHDAITKSGIITTFIDYLLGATAEPYGMKRTIVQATEMSSQQPTPAPTP